MNRKEATQQIVQAAKEYKPWTNEFRCQVEFILDACKTETIVEIPAPVDTCKDRMLSETLYAIEWIENSRKRIEERYNEIGKEKALIPQDTTDPKSKAKRDKLKAEHNKLYEFMSIYESIVKNVYYLMKQYNNAKKQETKSN